ncbi:MAG: anthranilate phosphoribosyltransferase [Chloroflexota bacterium]|jgi:anthranilate phosphoribosyltransferase|nr:MAG: anthranilate phosphoribosyltransferase [Chloroflexota bacterium]
MTTTAIQHAIHRLFAHHDLSAEEADAAMTQIMEGEATPAQVGAFLAALRMKGETVDEITGCARAMKRSAVPVRPQIGDAMLVDVVGTGGDSIGTFNISTTAAFVVAGHGVKVAKHGNRAVSSRSGSADVLAALGVNLQLTAEQAAECIEEVGLAFLFAPAFHPAMRHAIGPRRELAARTIFNILGPLTNPANATNLLVGVFDPKLTEPMAQVLGQMGARAAFVVHGAGGADELSLTGANHVSHLHNGEVRTYDFDAQELGLSSAAIAELVGGAAEENAAITRGILAGEIHGAKRDAVLLNAAFALSTECGDLAAGLEEARQSIDSGAARRVLDAYIQKTQSYGA